MKRKIVIIEDNYYKFFATKQLIESTLKVDVKVEKACNQCDIDNKTQNVGPNSIIDRPKGEVSLLLDALKKRNINRRNSIVLFIIVPSENSIAPAA